MATGYLPSNLGTIGHSIGIVADGDPIMKPGGMTIAWDTVTARAGTDVTWLDDVTLVVDKKGLRYGQLMCEITGGHISTVTITGIPTGGTFTITVANAAGETDTTTALDFDASAAEVDAALELLDTVGVGGVAVTGTAPYLLTFAPALGDLTVTADGALLTGGTTPAATAADTQEGERAGEFGPYDPDASDGRQTLTKGRCFWITHSILEGDRHSEYAGGLEGGRVFKDRLIATTGSASLADGPTFTALEAIFTDLRYVV